MACRAAFLANIAKQMIASIHGVALHLCSPRMINITLIDPDTPWWKGNSTAVLSALSPNLVSCEYLTYSQRQPPSIAAHRIPSHAMSSLPPCTQNLDPSAHTCELSAMTGLKL